MGSGIAQASAQAGLFTLLYDLNPAALEKARNSIEKALAKGVESGKFDATRKEKIASSIQYTSNLHSCLADFFIEAIAENLNAKSALFNQLAELNHSECVFASNTSSISITEIAERIKNPERVVGMHFFNPAPLMKLVEIVRGRQTNDATLETAKKLALMMQKTAVVCKDSPGFIVNRVARPYYLEALRLAEQNLAGPAQIDRILEGSGFRMGPFRLMDLIGNDINYAVSVSVYDQLGKPPRLQPSPMQEGMVAAGRLGKKSGHGYYDYGG
jgi:3-hydroxybutyryl-CoA dehydrogenase